jgi:hypothetical protein
VFVQSELSQDVKGSEAGAVCKPLGSGPRQPLEQPGDVLPFVTQKDRQRVIPERKSKAKIVTEDREQEWRA